MRSSDNQVLQNTPLMSTPVSNCPVSAGLKFPTSGGEAARCAHENVDRSAEENAELPWP
jgi:hypothetical protein